MSESVESVVNLNVFNTSEKVSTESVDNLDDVEMSEKANSVIDSVGNSNVVLYSPLPPLEKVTEVCSENIRFIIHRRGFITCICGKTLRKHNCILVNNYKEVTLKFDVSKERNLSIL